jgi:hypothetical protein
MKSLAVPSGKSTNKPAFLRPDEVKLSARRVTAASFVRFLLLA